MSSEKSRRDYLKYAGTAVVCGAVGAAAGFAGGQSSLPQVGPTSTVTSTVYQGGPTRIAGTPNPKSRNETLRIAGGGCSARDDYAFGMAMYDGIQNLAKKYPNIELVSYSEPCPYADYDSILSGALEKGIDIFLGLDAGWHESFAKIAPQYPDVWFMGTCVQIEHYYPQHTNNWFSLILWEHELGYIGGYMAGLMTKTNKVGWVGGEPYSCINGNGNAFMAAARLANPEVECEIGWAGSFLDPSKGKELAKGMIDAGCDVLSHGADSSGLGVIAAAKEAGLLVANSGGYDATPVAPDTVISDARMGYREGLEAIMENYFSGTLEPKSYDYTSMHMGGVFPIGPNENIVPADVKKKWEDEMFWAGLWSGVPRIEGSSPDWTSPLLKALYHK